MSYVERAIALRPLIEKAAVSLDDEDALQAMELYPYWSGDGVGYLVDDRVRYDEHLYKCLIAHTSQETWTPTDAPSLWAMVLIVDPTVIPEWVQPDSTNPYMTGDKVTHNGLTWISTVDNNVWEPGVYGWEEIVNN